MPFPWITISSFLLHACNFQVSFGFTLCNAGVTKELEKIQCCSGKDEQTIGVGEQCLERIDHFGDKFGIVISLVPKNLRKYVQEAPISQPTAVLPGLLDTSHSKLKIPIQAFRPVISRKVS